MDLREQMMEKRNDSVQNSKSDGETIFSKREEEDACPYCQGRGYTVVKGKAKKCRECVRVPRKSEVSEVTEEEVKYQMDVLNIPEFYRWKEFKPEILKEDEVLTTDVKRHPVMDVYIKRLASIHAEFQLGKKLDNSYLVMAPQGNAKLHFIYTSMVEALWKGKTVAPLYDTQEIFEMFKNDQDTLLEMIEKDVMFIKMLPAFLSKRDTQAVKYVLDKRALRELPTVVTSRFNTRYLTGIEPHLENNFGIKNVEKGNYGKLKEVMGVFPK